MQPVTATRPDSSPGVGAPAPVTTAGWTVASVSAGAGLIHLSAVAGHMTDSAVLGAGFVAAAWFQLIIALGSIARPHRRWYLANVVGTALLTTSWVVSRTVGLPVGAHTTAEPVGIADGICVGLQVVGAALSVALLRRTEAVEGAPASTPRRLSPWKLSPLVPVLGAAFLTTAAIAAPAGVSGHGHDETEAAGHAHDPAGSDHAAADGGDHPHGGEAAGEGHDHGEGPDGAAGDGTGATDHDNVDGMDHGGTADGTGATDHDNVDGMDHGGDGEHTVAEEGGESPASDDENVPGMDHGSDPTGSADDDHEDHTTSTSTNTATGTGAAAGTGHDHGTGGSASTDPNTATPGDGHEHAPDPGAGGGTGSGDAGGHQHAECTTPVNPAQQTAADLLVQMSRAAMAPYEDIDRAKADGFVPITPNLGGLQHFGRYDLMSDGVAIDPWKMESVIYAYDAKGNAYLVGGMFWQDDKNVAPPTPGGCATQWHNHTNLCIDPAKGMVGVVDKNGMCPPGSVNEASNAMLHVWYVDLPTGPFSELSEANAAAIRAGIIDKYL